MLHKAHKEKLGQIIGSPTPFTQEVLFHHDWLYVLSQEEELNYCEPSYTETMIIKKIDLQNQLDYQANESTIEAKQSLTFVGKCPSISINSSAESDYDIEQLLGNYRFALQTQRQNDGFRSFYYARLDNLLFYYQLELTMQQEQMRSIFKLYMFNLNDGSCVELPEMRKHIGEKQTRIAVQMVFVRRETERQYRARGAELSKQSIKDFLMQQIVAIYFIEKPR